MKSVFIALIVGSILLYFVNAALKVDIFNWEMFIHSSIRFFTGFLVIGIGFFYEHKIKLMFSVYLVLGLILADDIMDYVRSVNNFTIELMLHGIFMLFWGSVVGYLTIRFIKAKRNSEL